MCRWKGYLIAAVLYAGAHVWALNPMLLAAMLLCGLAWRWVFLRSGSLWPGIISHAVWDVTIFVVFPIR
ncbi:MAG: CPBP family intramembrane metalloprotease [Planctomycetes bacterium]|nr:CPBP family intramembrane metalloprotease [Planctomycetota bacterium]